MSPIIMTWYGIDSVDRAFSRTKSFLLEPFDFWKWARLALIIFLLNGLSAGSGNSGGSYHGTSGNLEQTLSDFGFGEGPESFGELEAGDFSVIFEKISSIPNFDLIVLGIVILLLIGLLFAYLSNVMEFVFVESLVSNEVKVLDYSKRFRGDGFRLFIIRILLGLVFLLSLGAAMFPFISNAIERGADPGWELILGGIAWFLIVLFVIGFISLVIGSFLNLAIPLSIYRKSGILSAFWLVYKNFRQSWKEILVYWGARLLLRLGTAIAATMLFLLVLLGLGLGFFLVDGILYFLLLILISEDLVWFGLAPVLFVEFLLLLGIMLFINVPFMVFLKYHMLSFLDMWYPGAEIPFFDRTVLK
ncbi:MAG: hypothetical protein PHW56_12390 [Methanosarcinaceae archaeon]|nr:hypothetical protein [Methanosarcinaceae archaeon]